MHMLLSSLVKFTNVQFAYSEKYVCNILYVPANRRMIHHTYKLGVSTPLQGLLMKRVIFTVFHYFKIRETAFRATYISAVVQ